MKPLPAINAIEPVASKEAAPSLTTILPAPSQPYSTANRRTNSCPVQRAYPWLLSASTTVAALFCLMYITKPVIVSSHKSTSQPSPKEAFAMEQGDQTPATLMPDANRLPGEAPSTPGTTTADPRRSIQAPAYADVFEETNLRIQHVLTAEAPGGHLARIDLDVPVLYQSRNLRWTAEEAAEARQLLVQLMDYQEKSRQLRSEGIQLLDSWNQLIDKSIPVGDLRADSPSLPANQQDTPDAPGPTGLSTTESIQIQPAGQ